MILTMYIRVIHDAGFNVPLTHSDDHIAYKKGDIFKYEVIDKNVWLCDGQHTHLMPGTIFANYGRIFKETIQELRKIKLKRVLNENN